MIAVPNNMLEINYIPENRGTREGYLYCPSVYYSGLHVLTHHFTWQIFFILYFRYLNYISICMSKELNLYYFFNQVRVLFCIFKTEISIKLSLSFAALFGFLFTMWWHVADKNPNIRKYRITLANSKLYTFNSCSEF